MGPQALKDADHFAALDNADLGWGHEIVHGLLYLPYCPVPLMGSDPNFFSADGSAKAGRTAILLDYDSHCKERRMTSVFLPSRIRGHSS